MSPLKMGRMETLANYFSMCFVAKEFHGPHLREIVLANEALKWDWKGIEILDLDKVSYQIS